MREQTVNTCSTRVANVLEQTGNPSMKTEDGSLKKKPEVLSHPTVDPSPLSPHCQTPNSKLEIPQQDFAELNRLQDEQIADATIRYEAHHRIEKRRSVLERLTTELLGEGWRS